MIEVFQTYCGPARSQADLWLRWNSDPFLLGWVILVGILGFFVLEKLALIHHTHHHEGDVHHHHHLERGTKRRTRTKSLRKNLDRKR